MIRVLHIYSGNLYGGVETLLVTLARHRHMCTEMEADFGLCFDGRLRHELEAAASIVHDLGRVRARWPLTVWRARRRLRDLLRRNHYDVLICHGVWAYAIFGPVGRVLGRRLVLWLHDLSRGWHWTERLARLTPPDLVVCNSRFTAETLPALYRDVPLEVLYYPVARPAIEPRSDGARSIRAALETSENAVVIVQTSRMERWKGHTVLLEALGRLHDVPGWVCWQIGGAQRPHEAMYFAELQGLTQRLGITSRVHFTGERSDVARFLAAADIYCQPNTAPEPFGIAFVQALYAGLPVVTAALGAAQEILDESCAVLVAPDDADTLASALRDLIEDSGRRGKLGAAAPARAGVLCDVDTQMERLRRALEQLVSSDGQRLV